jgi:hypothetical protein
MSKTIKCVLIPNDPAKPVREVSYDTADYTNLTALIFDGDRSGTFDRMVGEKDGEEVTLWFDDNGLFRLEQPGVEVGDLINLRAMQLFSHLNGDIDIRQYSVPLIGDYVITGGADVEGESLDCPEWVKDYPFTWHNTYAVEKRG